MTGPKTAQRLFRRLSALALGAAAFALLAAPSTAHAQDRRVRVGVLTCNVAPGIGFIVASQRDMTCVFRPERRGAREGYVGRVTRVGLDVGVTGRGVLAWTVFSSSRRLTRYQLAGEYGGASAQASLGVGVGPTRWSAARATRSSCSRCRSRPRPGSIWRSGSAP